MIIEFLKKSIETTVLCVKNKPEHCEKIWAQLPARRVGPTARREDQVFCDKINRPYF
jgi:hypothetical protein